MARIEDRIAALGLAIPQPLKLPPGAKLPFRWTMTWLDGRENVDLGEITPNAAIDSARFARPK